MECYVLKGNDAIIGLEIGDLDINKGRNTSG